MNTQRFQTGSHYFLPRTLLPIGREICLRAQDQGSTAPTNHSRAGYQVPSYQSRSAETTQGQALSRIQALCRLKAATVPGHTRFKSIQGSVNHPTAQGSVISRNVSLLSALLSLTNGVRSGWVVFPQCYHTARLSLNL